MAKSLPKRKRWDRVALLRASLHWQGMGRPGKIEFMKRNSAAIPLELIGSRSLSNDEIRRLIAAQALLLVDLLRRKCITVRYAEQSLFNLDTAKGLEKRKLKDCAEIIDWGMQLEDWEQHTPEKLYEALATMDRMAHKIISKSN